MITRKIAEKSLEIRDINMEVTEKDKNCRKIIGDTDIKQINDTKNDMKKKLSKTLFCCSNLKCNYGIKPDDEDKGTILLIETSATAVDRGILATTCDDW